VTFAGECDLDNCSKAVWSGGSVEDNQALVQLLAQQPEFGKITPACAKPE